MLSLTCHITVKQLLKSIFNSGVPVKLLDRFPKNILTKRQYCNFIWQKWSFKSCWTLLRHYTYLGQLLYRMSMSGFTSYSTAQKRIDYWFFAPYFTICAIRSDWTQKNREQEKLEMPRFSMLFSLSHAYPVITSYYI